MIKLTTLLREIGENTAAPYPFNAVSVDEGGSRYNFETDTGNLYRVHIDKYPGLVYVVSFSIQDREMMKRGVVKVDYHSEVSNDPRNLFRVMATVIAIVKEEISIDEMPQTDEETDETTYPSVVKKVTFQPTKRLIKVGGNDKEDPTDERRKKLYAAFAEKNMPVGSKFEEDKGEMAVRLPLERPLVWPRPRT